MLTHAPKSQTLSGGPHTWCHHAPPQAFFTDLLGMARSPCFPLPHWPHSLPFAGPTFLLEPQVRSLGDLVQFHDFKHHKLMKPLIFTFTSYLTLSNRLMYPATYSTSSFRFLISNKYQKHSMPKVKLLISTPKSVLPPMLSNLVNGTTFLPGCSGQKCLSSFALLLPLV